MSKTLRWKRGVWWKLVKQVYLVNHESGENWNFCGQHLCIHGHRTRLRCVGGVQEKNTAHPICHTKVTSCWNFSWHTLWSVRLCNRNSKSAKSSFQSKKKKSKSVQLSMDHSGRCDVHVTLNISLRKCRKRIYCSIPSGNLARCRNT